MRLIACGALTLLLAAPVAAETLAIPADRDATLIEQADGTLANGAGPALFVGRTNQADDSVRRVLLHFDLAGVPPRGLIAIERVALVLTVLPSNPGPREIRVHRVLADWGEGASYGSGGGGAPAQPGDVTWIHSFFPSSYWSQNGGQFDGDPIAAIAVSDPGVYRIEGSGIAEAVRQWHTKPTANFGLLLVGDETVRQSAKSFASRENPDPASRPFLEVTYGKPAP